VNQIDQPPIFYTVYLKKQSPSSPHFTVVGAYADIRDAVQAMVTAYRLKHSSQFGLESSVNKPLHWVHRSKYLT
jgi:acetaldehyde dehydrogenase (acetylating)